MERTFTSNSAAHVHALTQKKGEENLALAWNYNIRRRDYCPGPIELCTPTNDSESLSLIQTGQYNLGIHYKCTLLCILERLFLEMDQTLRFEKCNFFAFEMCPPAKEMKMQISNALNLVVRTRERKEGKIGGGPQRKLSAGNECDRRD